jgi:NADPH:quinone reductase-like Zn-dependent oxidoreductase
MPENVDFQRASAIPIAGLTALQALRNLGHITAGQKVLINGASGGVGTFAVQIAKIFGAHVTAVCSGSNGDFVKGLGAGRVVDYSRDDFTESNERYDIIFDAVSKRSFAECRRVLISKGIYIRTLPSLPVLLNQYLMGFLSGKKAGTVSVRPNAADMDWMKTQIEAGKVRIIIDRVYPLDAITEALAYSETGKARGKIILNI